MTTAILLGLAGCSGHSEPRVRGWVNADPTTRHPIHVGKETTHHDISVPRGSDGLSRRQMANFSEFVRTYKATGEGRLTIRAPSGSPNEVAAMRGVTDIRSVVKRAGLRSRDINFQPYFADGEPNAPIRVAFERTVATAPECGHWPNNLGRDPRNLPYANLGCAQQRNLAHMVSDPRDLLGPRAMGPRSSERRDVVWDKYVNGESTITERSEEESGQVSEVSGGGE